MVDKQGSKENEKKNGYRQEGKTKQTGIRILGLMS